MLIFTRILINSILDDHSRVKLKEAQNTDYINANLVENNYINRKYILTQVLLYIYKEIKTNLILYSNNFYRALLKILVNIFGKWFGNKTLKE